MTSRTFDDIIELSPDQALRFEARSPDNGNRVSKRGVTLPARNTGESQKSFRYQLYDIRNEKVLWERWQEDGDDSPVQAWVSNDGDVILSTSGMQRDLLMFVNRSGEVGLAIVVSSTPEEERECSFGRREENAARTIDRLRAENHRLNVASWRDASVRLTSAGPIWRFNSLPTFVNTSEGRFFSLRTAWGRRLTVNLDKHTLLEDSAITQQISHAVMGGERARALAQMRLAASTIGPQWYLADIDGALAVVIEQALREAMDDLRTLERREPMGTATWCVALGQDWWSNWDTTRALARHALRSLGEEPASSGNYRFTDGDPLTDVVQTPNFEGVATPSPSVAYQIASMVEEGASVEWVLANVGAPDDITQHFEKIGGGSEWAEKWEYDGPDGSVCIDWSVPAQRVRGALTPARHVAKVTHVDGWRTPRRLHDLLCLCG